MATIELIFSFIHGYNSHHNETFIASWLAMFWIGLTSNSTLEREKKKIIYAKRTDATIQNIWYYHLFSIEWNFLKKFQIALKIWPFQRIDIAFNAFICYALDIEYRTFWENVKYVVCIVSEQMNANVNPWCIETFVEYTQQR